MSKTPSKTDFQNWRNPRRASKNPEKMNNVFWEWCIKKRQSAYAINEEFEGPNSMEAGPCWCFDRMGQSHLKLADGREIFIAGEHEDHYDPDFYIYNDVVVIDGEKIDIYQYSEEDFPPTDFHTATLVGTDIILIGNLGYPDDRRTGETQVLKLDTLTMKMSRLKTTGEAPNWLHDHSAEYQEADESILITGGKLYGERLTDNYHDYALCLKSLEWKVTLRRDWPSWILERTDDEANQIWEIRQEWWNRELNLDMQSHIKESFEGLDEEFLEDLVPVISEEQLEDIQKLYQSPFNDSLAQDDEENYGRYLLEVEKTVVRFDEDMYGVTITIEGQLPQDKSEKLLSTIKARLEALDDSAYKVTKIHP